MTGATGWYHHVPSPNFRGGIAGISSYIDGLSASRLSIATTPSLFPVAALAIKSGASAEKTRQGDTAQLRSR